MKKVLFVIGSANVGGTITSLLNLLSLLDENRVEVDLFLQNHAGLLLPRAKEYNLLPEDKLISSVICTKQELKQKGVRAYLIRVCYAVLHHLIGSARAYNYICKKSANKLSKKKYDVVVAYQEGHIAAYTKNIKCGRRIAWCHTDYKAFTKTTYSKKDYWSSVYSNYDQIACVSEVIKNSLLTELNYPSNRISVVRNTIPPGYIYKRASEAGKAVRTRAITFVSSGRYASVKRFDRVVLAAEFLRDNDIDFIWYLLGDGDEYEKISNMIKERNLENHLIQEGAVENPFIYYKIADCFVMSSENEGQPMVLNEAMTLKIPVITTDFPSSREIVKDGEYGIIVSNDDNGVKDGVLRFATDECLRQALKRGVSGFEYGNNAILEKVYDMLNVDGNI